MQKSLQDLWTNIETKCCQTKEGGTVKDYKRYTILLPETREGDYRDPMDNWNVNDVGFKGSSNYIPKI